MNNKDFCILELDEKRKCDNCGECDICDLNRNKKCDNCMECIFDVESRCLKVDEIDN